jgi:uncharacterized protein (TIGR03086 family)
MRSDEAFTAGLDCFDAVVERMTPLDWGRPGPCAGWTALDVLGHMGSGLRFGASLLRGEQPTFAESERPADLVEGEPAEFWRITSQQCREALVGADLDQEMDTPMGRRTVADRLAFPAVDLFVHAWDIGAPAGIAVEVPEEVIAFSHGYIDPLPAELVRGTADAPGAFGPEVAVGVDATPTEAFLAWTGRDPAFAA